MHTAGARVCGPTADGSLRRLARALRGCAASIKLLFRPGINATGRPVLGRRRSRVPLTQAAVFLLAAFELETVNLCQHRSTLRPTRLRVGEFYRPVIPHSAFRIPHSTTPASMACAAPPLRPGAPYGRILATDFLVLREDAIHTPGLSWAATSMIAAFCHSSFQPMTTLYCHCQPSTKR